MRVPQALLAGDVHVLVVGDDPAANEKRRIKLERDGYAVAVADHSRGLDAARHHPPDLVFLEIRRGSSLGTRLLRALRTQPCSRQVPVVLFTDRSARELAEQGVWLGPLDHLVRLAPRPLQLAQGPAR
jgi:two-component system phosphate regulon response regulator PhoB